MSNGYVVESFADAPMRVRAWFENEDDAREYAGKLGASAYMHAGEILAGDALDALKQEAIGRDDEIAYLTRALDTAKAEAEDSQADAERAESEADDARDEARDANDETEKLRVELAALRKEAA